MLRRVAHAALAIAREVVASSKEALVIVRDVRQRMPADLRSEDHLVVLLHGIFATAGAMAYLRRQIERRTAARTASFTWLPGSDVRRLVDRLATFLAGVPEDVRIHLVGHSMGGLVARYYVQVSPTDPRVVQTISLASPFAGSLVAALVPRWFAADVVRGSPLLDNLQRCWSTGVTVPHTSFVASHDQWVVPAESAAYAHGEVVRMEGRAHNALLFDDAVAAAVVERLQRLGAGGDAPSKTTPPVIRIVSG